MVLRAGAHGPFAGCTAYPVCKKTLPVGRKCTPAWAGGPAPNAYL